MNKYSVALCSGILLWSSQSGAQGAQPLDEEVIVTSTRLEESLPVALGQYGSRVEVITAEQVKQTGSYDVAGALEALAPGMYVSPKNGAFDYVDVSFQGSRRSDILWLVDGVRINNRLYSTTTPLDTIPSNMVERIEVLEGGQGLFYGTQAVAGVVNVVTKAFSDKPSGAVSVGADTDDGKHVNAFWRGSAGSHRFVVYASKDEADGFEAFRRQDYQASSTDRERSYDVLNLGAKYAHDFTDDVRFSLTYQHTDADLDFAQPYLVRRNVNSRDEDLATAKLDYRVNDQVALYFKGYYHDWDTSYDTTYNVVGSPGQTEVIYNNAFWGFWDYGVNALLQLKLQEGFEYYLGYDMQNYWGKDDVWLIGDRTEKTQAVFAQVRTTPELFKNAHLAAGLRYSMPDKADSSTIWTASGQYDFSENLFVRANVGTAFRLPSAEELFLIEPCCRGNPDLQPEKSKNLNLSIGGRQGAFNWELIGFLRDIDDLINWDYDPDTDIETAFNSDGKVKVRGGELVLRSALGESFSTAFSYTYNRARMEGSDLQVAEIPEQLVKLGLNYDSKQLPFGASLTVNYVGDLYDNTFMGRVQHGDYTVVDVSARYFVDQQRRHRVDASLQNVFDKEYASSLGGGFLDADDSRYLYWNVGVPRLLRVSYTYSFQ